jgi:multiple sugar transport system permease protein
MKILSRKKIESIFNNKKILPYILLIPVILWLGFAIFYPIFDGIRLSFYDVKVPMIGKKANFIFLDNYIEMFQRADFRHSLRVTVSYTVLFLVGTVLMGLGTALLLNANFKGRSGARAAIIIPWAMPYVVAVLVWRWILDYHAGILNYILKDVLHLVSKPIEWTLDPKIAIYTVVIIAIWKEFPIATVMYLAGLQTIPRHLYEVADIDGANAIHKFFRITLPLLKPVNVILILLLTVWAFKRVTVIYVLTKGGPARATETLVIQSYLQAFNFFHMSYGAAIGTFMLVVSLIMSIIYLKIGLKSEE